ncbi:hypothetical protein ACVXFG_004822, partial [Escherichia coli]
SAKWRGGKYGGGSPFLANVHRVVRLTIRLSDNPAATTHVDYLLAGIRFVFPMIPAPFKVNFVMR